MIHRRLMLLAGAALAAGCTSTNDPAQASAKRREIDTKVDSALGDLFVNARNAREFYNAAAGVLVFPDVLTAGLVVGGSHGHGALRKGNEGKGYFTLNSGSVGLLAGAQTRTLYVFFMTQAALDRFLASDGWTMGGDASAVVMDAGAMARLDKGTSPSIIALVRNQQGFMGNLSLDGTKISRLKL